MVIVYTHAIDDYQLNFDGLAKSRRTGENRCPVFPLLAESAGFRLLPE
jgi:hypothetical protein